MNRGVIVLMALALIWLAYTIARSLFFYGKTEMLFTQSASFPREYTVGNSADPAITYVVLGDSTAQGTGVNTLEGTLSYQIALHLADEHQYVHVINRAKSGAKMADVVTNQLEGLVELHPTVITVSCGANDATHFTPIDSFNTSLQTVISQITASGATTIAMANTPDTATLPALFFPYTRLTQYWAEKQNAILAQALQGTDIKSVDLYGAGKLSYNADHNVYAADHFHPSTKGYAVWVSLFDKVL